MSSDKQSWIENSDVVSLFPTLVWKIQLRAEVHEPIDASALGLLHSLRQGQPELKTGEAWQSGHALHRREELRTLCDCVNRAAASVLRFLKIGVSERLQPNQEPFDGRHSPQHCRQAARLSAVA